MPPVAPRQGARKSGRGPFHGLEKEAKLGPVLHAEVLAALKQLQAKRPGLGEVFEGERAIAYAAITELTLGVQVGGTTFHELVVFRDGGTLEVFKSGKYALAVWKS